MTLLLVGAELGDADPEFLKLIAAARARLKRPWKSAPFDFPAIKTALGEKANIAQNAVTLSDQIGPILARGAQGNPRQIKRFLNSLLLRQRMAEARGFGDDVKLPVLAKLMLAERFIPRLFDQIAYAAASDEKGACGELAALEAATAEKPAPTKKASSRSDGDGEAATQAGEGALLAEWLSSSPIRAWAQIKPTLAGTDLRPYLFVTKDRKDYFGAASALGHLASVVDKLLGPKIGVQGLEGELKKLAAPEAAQIFEALRARIMGEDSLVTEPPGVAGMAVLVKAHPPLQASLLDFLEALPTNRCGAWPVSGWADVITEASATARLTKLIEGWAASAKNPALKATAGSALKVKARRV